MKAYACTQSKGRTHAEQEHAFRSAFSRDRDRVVHSSAFRRLEFKTQVFVYFENDYYRTRLTHTIEVSQIARTLSAQLGLNEDLAEAIALAHDIGHPPYGHAGEQALDGFSADCGGFNHNIQGLRICDRLERKYRNFRGLNLSWEVREGFAKHGSGRSHMPEEFVNSGTQPSLEAQIVDLSDGIAYNAHDLDDGLVGGLLHWEDVLTIPVVAAVMAEKGLESIGDPDVRRAELVRGLIDRFVTDALNETRQKIASSAVQSADDARNQIDPLATLSNRADSDLVQLKVFLREHLYLHPQVVRMTEKAGRTLTRMAEALLCNPRQLSPVWFELGEEDGFRRAITDYLASLTDKSAIEVYAQLFDPAARINRT